MTDAASAEARARGALREFNLTFVAGQTSAL